MEVFTKTNTTMAKQILIVHRSGYAGTEPAREDNILLPTEMSSKSAEGKSIWERRPRKLNPIQGNNLLIPPGIINDDDERDLLTNQGEEPLIPLNY